MSEVSSAKLFRRTLIASSAAAALFAGFVAAPSLLSQPANAQRIEAPAIAPPNGAPASFAPLIERVSPAVVSIRVRIRADSGESPFANGQLPPWFEDFLEQNPNFSLPRREGQALGSGFFIAADGVLVTNNHVVENASEIIVVTNDGKEHRADLVGADAETDLAVLKLKTPGSYPFVAFDRAASNNVRVGDWVVAVGNPFGLDGSATAGIVSAKGRSADSAYVEFLQIDAPINRGNSGGPTFDLLGNVIGVNSAIISQTGGNVGIGFAIPADTAALIVDQIRKNGRVSRGYIGVRVQPLDDAMAQALGLKAAKGAMVAGVTEGTPGALAGLREGDLILRIDGQDIEDQRDLTRKVGRIPVGKTVRLDLLRDGKNAAVSLKLTERPSPQQIASVDTGREGGAAGPASAGQARQTDLGVRVRPVTESDRQRLSMGASEAGLLITDIEPDSDLARKGVTAGVAIVAAEGKALRAPGDLDAAVAAAKKAGRPLLLQVQTRAGRSFVAAEIKSG
jgi:serine protease Do